MGKRSKLTAAVLLDAAEDWESAVLSLDRRCPLLSLALSGGAKRTVHKQSGIPVPEDVAVESAEDDIEPVPGGILAFIRDSLAPALGWSRSMTGAREYLRACRLAKDLSGCAVPTLELVS